MANIQVFEYQNSKVRTVDMDGEAWFVLKDVCAVLGISNNRMAADRLDDDEKGVSLIDTLGGKQERLFSAPTARLISRTRQFGRSRVKSSSMSSSRSWASRRESRPGLLQNSKTSEDGRTEHGADYHLESRP